MKTYTKTGDGGETGLFAGPRVPKDHPRIDAFGAVDELNAALGQTRASDPLNTLEALLAGIQRDLFAVGAELASPDPNRIQMQLIGDGRVAALEAAIDQHEADLPPLTQFILPAGTALAASLHMARGICRRAERCVVRLSNSEVAPVSERIIRYLNRLGDLLFVLARSANASAGVPDEVWEAGTAESESG